MTRRDAEWRHEQGPGYDLRQYQRGKPTGLVAVLGWHHNAAPGTRHATGPEVRLARDRGWVLIEEHGPGASLRLPIRSCLDARLDEEPGLPGATLVRLTLSARIGHAGAFTIPLWFSLECRPFLRGLVDEIARPRPPKPFPAPRSTPRGTAPRAPIGPDWVVFRAASDEERES